MEHKVYESLIYVTARNSDGGYGFNVPVRLMYQTRDPFAMSLVFVGVNEENDGDEFVEWTFARDLLASGVVSSQLIGVGDIKVRRDDDLLVIEMHNGEEGVTLTTPRRPVMRFLHEIYRAVPEGYEMNLVSVDDFIRSCHA
jgi:hypothetical protein